MELMHDSRVVALAAKLCRATNRRMDGDNFEDAYRELMDEDAACDGLDLDDPLVEEAVAKWLAHMLFPDSAFLHPTRPTFAGVQVPPVQRVGCVYFVLHPAAERVKVGFTVRSVDVRLRELSTGAGMALHLLGSIPGTMELEQEIHQGLADHRIYGEWFAANPQVMSSIDAMIRANA